MAVALEDMRSPKELRRRYQTISRAPRSPEQINGVLRPPFSKSLNHYQDSRGTTMSYGALAAKLNSPNRCARRHAKVQSDHVVVPFHA